VKGDRRIGTQVGQVLATGRPRAIPFRLIPELLQRHDRGEGYRMLSRWLKRCGIDASPAACRRAALGLTPYTEDYG
jgi:hypothetical protein